jgi:hypothetical protein
MEDREGGLLSVAAGTTSRLSDIPPRAQLIANSRCGCGAIGGLYRRFLLGGLLFHAAIFDVEPDPFRRNRSSGGEPPAHPSSRPGAADDPAPLRRRGRRGAGPRPGARAGRVIDTGGRVLVASSSRPTFRTAGFSALLSCARVHHASILRRTACAGWHATATSRLGRTRHPSKTSSGREVICRFAPSRLLAMALDAPLALRRTLL